MSTEKSDPGRYRPEPGDPDDCASCLRIAVYYIRNGNIQAGDEILRDLHDHFDRLPAEVQANLLVQLVRSEVRRELAELALKKPPMNRRDTPQPTAKRIRRWFHQTVAATVFIIFELLFLFKVFGAAVGDVWPQGKLPL